MSLTSTVSEINGDFSLKISHFPTPIYFAPLLTGFPFPLELGIGAKDQKTTYGPTRRNKNFDGIFSHVDAIHQCDRRTDRHDGQTPDDSKDRAYA